MSHSKRNTSRSVFTSYERDLAKAAWASNTARLTRDSYLPFGSCYLCLEIARDPVSCSHGDIFCRECAISNLLAQKKEIKRLTRAREKAQQDLQDAVDRDDAEAQKRAVKDFETIQAGLTLAPQPARTEPAAKDEPDRPIQPGKRKAVFDEEEAEKIAKDDRAKARKTIDQETSKDKMPSFWTPSQTPGTNPLEAAVWQQRNSKATPHPLSLKTLQQVKFSKEESDANAASTSTEAKSICPSCMKALGNASRPMMANACGHVLCRSCVTKFIKPSKAAASGTSDQSCFVCESPLATGSTSGKINTGAEFPGLIELRSDGTGFSARGPNKVEKNGVAFQC
ncbi:hypothetical protein ACHAQA_001075 [Verticillium albo-atrum]